MMTREIYQKRKWQPQEKPQPFWWAHEANCKSALIDMAADTAAIYTLGEGHDAAYCAAKKTEKGLCFYCDDGKWHYAYQMMNAPEIDTVRR